MSTPNLTRDEARERARLLADVAYTIRLDLTGDHGFRSETVVRFGCAEPGAETFVDLQAAAVRSIELNGKEVPAGAFDGRRIPLRGLEADNELRVIADCAYQRTGKGMNRFVDPVDDEVYVHSDFEPFDAHRGYACFDQPDIKAAFRFEVLARSGWEVLSNTRAEGPPVEEGTGAFRWTFEPTPPVPTYITAVVAGPFHGVHDRDGDIDLGVYCRRSLAEHLEPEEWFEITRQGFDFFQRSFGHPYPFGTKYDQVVVPEYGAGAMENAGCVTYNERYVFRSRVTRSARELRAGTILHEMAHMWFGDLVTMRWWDDLWLNESFASWAGVLAEVEATRFTEGWTVFAHWDKTWAHRQDQLPTTHPIVADAPDIQTALLNFDGITYAKGAAVLRQLVAWVGLERFLEGLEAYFARFGFKNADLADFLGALEEASGRDLRAWSREWLESSGINTVAADADVDDGAYRSFAVIQEAPPGSDALRRHRLAVGLYEDRDGRLVRRRSVELDVLGDRTTVPELEEDPVVPLVVVNDGDLTYAKTRLDERSLATVVDRLADVEDELTRAVCWRSAWDMARDSELPARRFLEMVVRNASGETVVSLQESALANGRAAVGILGDPANRAPAGQALAEAALKGLRDAEPGSDHQLAWARAFFAAARSDDHLDLARAVLDEEVTFAGLAVDADLRWHIVGSLAAAGRGHEDLIAAELERDPTDKGRRFAASARASRPDAAAKAEAWDALMEPGERTLATLLAIMGGFQQPDQEDLLAPYAPRYFEALPGVWESRPLEEAVDFAERMYPRHVVGPGTLSRTEAALEGEIPGPLRRVLLEGADDVRRALRAREADATAG